MKKIIIIISTIFLLTFLIFFSISPNYLMKVGKSKFTVEDFNENLELSKIAYNYTDIKKNKSALKFIKIKLFNELKNDLFLLEFARIKKISVNKNEIKQHIETIKKSFSDNIFETFFIEKAIKYSAWEQKQIRDLIIKKIIRYEIPITIGKDEFIEYYKKYIKNNENKTQNEINKIVFNLLKNDKIEEGVRIFIKKLESEMQFKINEKEWKKIINETPMTTNQHKK